jgi:membrane protease YdiL (CAAX protease family)
METHSESRAVWARIATFVGITYVWSWIFMSMAISAGKITTIAALGGMWSPFVGLLVTRIIFPDGRRRGSLGGLGWRWGRTRWQMWSYLLPVLYVGAAYGATWAFGLAGFTNDPAREIAVGVVRAIALGTIFNSIVALGEEIGWQGYLVPQLFGTVGFTKTAFLRGLIWSVWHYPLIIGGVYGATETPLWYRLVCFTVTLTSVSFAFSWLRIKSGSLWTGVLLHAMHNLYSQEAFPLLTADRPATAYFTGEFGAFSAIAALIVAVVFWSRRGSLHVPAD